VEYPILLLVGEVVLLVDDDQSEIAKGQEERRTCADDNLRRPGRGGAPHAFAAARRHARMPFRRAGSETSGKPLEEVGSESDFGEEDERLPPLVHRCRNRLEIDLGLAGTGDAV